MALGHRSQLELVVENVQYLDQSSLSSGPGRTGGMAEPTSFECSLERERNFLAPGRGGRSRTPRNGSPARHGHEPDLCRRFLLEDVSLPPGRCRPENHDRARPRQPRFAAARASTRARARANVDAGEIQAKPDWSVSMGYKRTAGFNTLLAGVSVRSRFSIATKEIFFSARAR